MRRLRPWLAALAGILAAVVVLTAVVLRMDRPASAAWTEFSMGPASGRSASIGTNTIRSDGMTLKMAVATAYDVPAVRVIAPAWLARTRYSINAVVGTEASATFRSLLQQELNNRLHLETHFEVRPFDVFVLTATDAPRLGRASGNNVRIWVRDKDAQLQDASMAGLGSALEGILGKPVIDETGITGSYNFEFGWGEDRVESVTRVMRNRFGLTLSPARRDMEALIVDRIRRDAALVLLAEIGRITSKTPPQLRRQIAELLTIR
jgi:uncharacterized protein (TIGR03435 family)